MDEAENRLALPAFARFSLHSLFGLPTKEPVWIFGLAWELRMPAVPQSRLLGHVWFLVVRAFPPHEVIGQESCQ